MSLVRRKLNKTQKIFVGIEIANFIAIIISGFHYGVHLWPKSDGEFSVELTLLIVAVLCIAAVELTADEPPKWHEDVHNMD